MADFDISANRPLGDFKSVLCHELWSTGISFWLDAHPSSRFVMFDLTTPDYRTQLIAEVKLVTPMRFDRELKVLVSCAFAEGRR